MLFPAAILAISLRSRGANPCTKPAAALRPQLRSPVAVPDPPEVTVPRVSEPPVNVDSDSAEKSPGTYLLNSIHRFCTSSGLEAVSGSLDDFLASAPLEQVYTGVCCALEDFLIDRLRLTGREAASHRGCAKPIVLNPNLFSPGSALIIYHFQMTGISCLKPKTSSRLSRAFGLRTWIVPPVHLPLSRPAPLPPPPHHTPLTRCMLLLRRIS